MKERIILQAFSFQQLSQDEIIKMIPEETLREIKLKDEHPYFQVYSICHDGISNPKLLKDGEKKNEKIHWTKQAVQSMKNVIKKGLKFFHLHNKDNSTVNRREIGEIIAHSQQEIKGKLHQLAIGYFPPETREEAKKYDVCSHEGVWEFIISAGKKIADKISDLTGIALGSSDEDIPAFAESRRLGMVQCFAESSGELDNKEGGEPSKKEVKFMSITLKDVIDYIVENNVHITQLPFDIEDVKADRKLGKIITDLEAENKSLKTFQENATKEKEEFEKKIKEYEGKENLTKAKTIFSEMLKTAEEKKTIGEREKKFIEKRFEKESIEDLTDAGLKKFFDEKLEEYKTDIAPLIGDETEIYKPNGSAGNVKNNDPADMTKAENNELLEEDYDPYNM
jgi:hypothetical protein